jgi:hypothetical protein
VAFRLSGFVGFRRLIKEKLAQNICISDNPTVGKQQLPGILSQPSPAKHNSITRLKKHLRFRLISKLE